MQEPLDVRVPGRPPSAPRLHLARVRSSASRRSVRGDTVSTRSSRPEEVTMANKDKGGSKSSKTAASKSLKEKREAKKAKAAGSGSSSTANWTKK